MEEEAGFYNNERMFIPLTIDDLEMESQNYFFSGKKFMIAALSLLPYIAIFFFLDYVPNIQVFLIYTLFYLIGYSYVIRFAVFEESRQKEQLRQLENNKYSDFTNFWQLDKVGSGERDDGMLYIQSDGITIRRSYIIEVDGGSTIGIPANAYANYRDVWQKFFRMAYNLDFEVKIYNVRKKPELSDSLKDYNIKLQDIDDEAYRNLMQLNIETNFLYAVSEEQRYITYIEVINKRIDNLVNFRVLVQDIIDKTFKTDGLFADPRILGKTGVDNMLATYFGQDHVNTRGIHRTNGYKSISEYAEVVSVYDRDGNAVPIDLLDKVEEEQFNKNVEGGHHSLEDLIEKGEEEEKVWEEKVEKAKDERIRELQRLRKEERITFEEYEQKMEEVEEKLTPEKATEYDLLDEQGKKRYKREQEKAEQRKEREKGRERKRREKELADKEESDEKWYEGEELSLEELLGVEKESKYESEEDIKTDSISLEDILRMEEEKRK